MFFPFFLSLKIRCWLDYIYIYKFVIYDVLASISDVGVWCVILRDRLTYLVKIGIWITVVCLSGIDDFDVDGRRYGFYNEETLVILSIGKKRSKFCDNIGVVCRSGDENAKEWYSGCLI